MLERSSELSQPSLHAHFVYHVHVTDLFCASRPSTLIVFLLPLSHPFLWLLKHTLVTYVCDFLDERREDIILRSEEVFPQKTVGGHSPLGGGDGAGVASSGNSSALVAEAAKRARANSVGSIESTESTREKMERKIVTKLSEKSVMLFLSLLMFLGGLIYTTRNGVHCLEVIDHFCPTYCLLISGFLEFVLFGHVCGIDKVLLLIEDPMVVLQEMMFVLFPSPQSIQLASEALKIMR